MTCLPGNIRTCLSTDAYNRRVTGEGDNYRQRLQRRTNCPECGDELAVGSLIMHRRRQHGVEPEINWNTLNVTPAEQPSSHYTVSFPRHAEDCECPVEGCPYQAKSRVGLRYHFHRRHWRDTIHITEEHPNPYPRCEYCHMQVPFSLLNNRHFNTDQCRAGRARRRQREAEQLAYEASQRSFTVNGTTLERVNTFVYLGRSIAFNNSDWPVLYRNLKKAQQRWAMVVRVLEHEGASPRAKGLFYKAIVQAVLLYSCETWVITDAMLRVLDGFHHKAARRITGNMPQRLPDGQWYYRPIEEVLSEAGLYPIQTYVWRRQTKLVDYVATRPVYGLCTAAAPLTGSPRSTRWWQQNHEPDEDGSFVPSDSPDSATLGAEIDSSLGSSEVDD